MSTDAIVYEAWPHDVRRVSRGYYQVFRHSGTHAALAATIHFRDRPDYALQRAIAECNRRTRAETSA